jgi:methionyl-tRNA formyltransferase
MKITLLCSDPDHPVNQYLLCWMHANQKIHDVSLVRSRHDLPGGHILVLISCSEIITAIDRAAYKASLILHASDLPLGRGWSPHIWQIISGAEQITVSLLEAEDAVDSGRIWCQITLAIPKHALWDEINALLFKVELKLIDNAISVFDSVTPISQNPDIKPTYYRKRNPLDSKIDPEQSIASQFDQIRVCDPERFPAYFDFYGHTYKLKLEKVIDDSD